MRVRKYKYIIETGKGLVTEFYTLEEIEEGKVNLINHSLPRRIVARLEFTGLKDKNNIEIYERDIIKDSSNRLMLIMFDNRIGTARFIFKAINEISHIKTGRYLNTHEWITSTENDVEIVGNKYFNQDLMGFK